MNRHHALTREVPASLVRCQLSHVERRPLDVGRAREQHARYRGVLEEAGYIVQHLPADEAHPDSVFVEDAALIIGQRALITRPGALTRRAETEAIAAALDPRLQQTRLGAPANLDGGDVLRIADTVYVGLSGRTNAAAAEALRDWLEPAGLRLQTVPLQACLHLKTGVTALSDTCVLLQPDWVPAEPFAGLEVLHTAPGESGAANVLRLHDRLVLDASFPETRRLVEARGDHCVAIEFDEFARAEAGLTCCSLLSTLDSASA